LATSVEKSLQRVEFELSEATKTLIEGIRHQWHQKRMHSIILVQPEREENLSGSLPRVLLSSKQGNIPVIIGEVQESREQQEMNKRLRHLLQQGLEGVASAIYTHCFWSQKRLSQEGGVTLALDI
jgi:hypothetical protein